MNLCSLEDMMANTVLVNAKNDMSSRKKWINKVRFPDDTICDSMKLKVSEDIKRMLPTNCSQDQAQIFEFNQICELQPIGIKQFREFCETANEQIKNAFALAQAIHNYEIVSFEDRLETIRNIVKTNLSPDGKLPEECITTEIRDLLNFLVVNDTLPNFSSIEDFLKTSCSCTTDTKNECNLQQHILHIAENLCKSSGDQKCFFCFIKIATEQIKSYVSKYLSKQGLSEFKKSDNYKTFLKWKYLEKETVSEESFTPFRLLGRGGFGEVYAYQVNMTGKMYACKKIDKKRMKLKHAEKVVLAEKLVLEKVNSRFVVSLAYAFDSKSSLNLVMTLMGGGDLKFHIYETDRKNRGVNPERCKFYSAQITLGLAHLHKENILYRDMKPENVLLDDDGNCRIADLGLAHIVENDEQVHGKAGTVGYMAPEMINHEPYLYGVDWFALGCTIYEMCEGRGPFVVRDKVKRKMNQEETIQKTLSGSFKFHRDHSEDLMDLIESLLHKDVELRQEKNNKMPHSIQNHPYFSDINWDRLEAGIIPPPFIPNPNQVYAKDVSNIRLASDVKGVNITTEDKQFFSDFATGRIPVSWQQEILETGVYEEITKRNVDGTGKAFNPSNQKSSKMCSLV